MYKKVLIVQLNFSCANQSYNFKKLSCVSYVEKNYLDFL